ncbi:MAG: hypothetical protein PHX44_03990 [Sulfurimonas sp.]|uniref:hypothetical protein n=1 Tax=Sulfurimonas sp. TaxID=2022749 RepID=UPI002609097A|nr:hypothetical protein [Sulfurimonas sp.]MDD2652192.1 hypothetical protein [Sulfurimonas sp.]MDD3450525.1 hypothetical protein [Sulfurimonas sp.]
MVSVRLDNMLENQLNLVSAQLSKQKSQIIKEALVYYFDMLKSEAKEKTSYELGKELFGKFESHDGSLSTTYKQKLKAKLHDKNTH